MTADSPRVVRQVRRACHALCWLTTDERTRSRALADRYDRALAAGWPQDRR